MEIGVTISHPHARWLGLDPLALISIAKELHMRWIRLGCYWNEIQPHSETFNFGPLIELVEKCEQEKLKVVLTIGMKAPRWPEFHQPHWWMGNVPQIVSTHDLDPQTMQLFWRYYDKSIRIFRHYDAIQIWQIENEPYDPSGPSHAHIDSLFVNNEVERLKSLDDTRPILLSLWGNALSRRNFVQHAINSADIVGLDIYPKVPLPVPGLSKILKYVGPLDSKNRMRQISEKIKEAGKQVWITEIQSEPWESDESVRKSANPPSFTTEQFSKNWDWVNSVNPDVTLLWGIEYWTWREKQGDLRYLESVTKLITNLKV